MIYVWKFLFRLYSGIGIEFLCIYVKENSLKEQKRNEEENNNKRNMIYELLKIIKNVKFMIYIFMFLIIFCSQLFPLLSAGST